MEYTRENIENELYLEMVSCQEEGEISDRLNEIFVGIINYNLERLDERLSYRIRPENKSEIITAALIACHNHGFKFKKDKLKSIYTYISIIIRCSFAGNLKKLSSEKVESKIKTTVNL